MARRQNLSISCKHLWKNQRPRPKIGVCIDTGHTFRLKQDPAAEFRKYRDRLFDIHLKDLNKQTPDAENVEIGCGEMNISLYIQVLKELKYEGIISVEYEKDAEIPHYGLTESVGYLRGILRMSWLFYLSIY